MMITWRISLLVLLFVGFISRTSDQLHKDGSNIRFERVMTKNEFQNFSVIYFAKHHPYPHRKPTGNLIQILLILSGTIELNPGPKRGNIKYPCGECKKAVRNVNAIACDQCQKWYHTDCLSMNANVFDSYTNDQLLEWTCINCALVNISNSVFDSCMSDSDSSIHSEPDEKPKKTKSHSLRIMIINFQSIWGKKEFLQKTLYDHNIDIVIGSETHIDPSISNSEIIPKGYTAFRNDRSDSWGGVIIIVKETLSAVEEYKSKVSELITIKVETFQKPVIITSAYRKPDKNQNYMDNLVKDIKTIINNHKTNPHWIGGDMNLPDIDWSTNSITAHRYPKAINEAFLDMIGDTNTEQLVDFPTRKQNTLELLLTNNPSFVTSIEDTTGISDHDRIVIADIICHPRRNRPIKRTIHLWNRANIPDMKESLKSDINDFCQRYNCDTQINELWNSFTKLTETAMSKIPTKETSTRYHIPWINRECKRMSRRQKRAYRKAKRTNAESDWQRFQSLRKKKQESIPSSLQHPYQ